MDAYRPPTEDSAPSPLGDALGSLLSDPAMLSRISSLMGALSGGKPDSNTADSDTASDDAQSQSASTQTAEPAQPANAPPPGNLEGGLASVLSNPELMAKLPEVMATLAPMLTGGKHQNDENSHKDGDKEDGKDQKHAQSCDKRIALLRALKPYLSPRRCEAIDYIIKLDRI